MTLSSHLFESSSGELYDTRAADWSARPPLRAVFSQLESRPSSGQYIRAALRHGGYAWPGGYPIHAHTADGGTLCFPCVRANLREVLAAMAGPHLRDGWRVDSFAVLWESSGELCDSCGRELESAYGPDDDDDDNNTAERES